MLLMMVCQSWIQCLTPGIIFGIIHLQKAPVCPFRDVVCRISLHTMKIHSTTFLLITLLLSTALSSAEVFLPYHRAHVPRGGGRVVRTPPGASSSRGLTGAVASRVVHEPVKEVKKQLDWTSWGFRDAIFGGLAVVAAATSTTAIMVEATLIVTIVGVLCIGLGVSSAFLQKRLTEFESKCVHVLARHMLDACMI
jgi:hypothetical protein